MKIETERLLLEEVSATDLENIHTLHSFPEVDEFNTLGIPKDIEETREVLRPMIQSQSVAPQVHSSSKYPSRNQMNSSGFVH